MSKAREVCRRQGDCTSSVSARTRSLSSPLLRTALKRSIVAASSQLHRIRTTGDNPSSSWTGVMSCQPFLEDALAVVSSIFNLCKGSCAVSEMQEMIFPQGCNSAAAAEHLVPRLHSLTSKRYYDLSDMCSVEPHASSCKCTPWSGRGR